MAQVQETLSISIFFSLKYNLNYPCNAHNKLLFGSVQAEAPLGGIHPARRVSLQYDNKCFYCFLNYVIITCHRKSNTVTGTTVRCSDPSHARFLGGRKHRREPWPSGYLWVRAGISRMRIFRRSNFSLRQPSSNWMLPHCHTQRRNRLWRKKTCLLRSG